MVDTQSSLLLCPTHTVVYLHIFGKQSVDETLNMNGAWLLFGKKRVLYKSGVVPDK